MSLSVATLETGVIRVFALNRPPEEITRDLKTRGAERIAGDLLDTKIASGGAEIVALADLTGVGLSGYLADGYAVPAEQLSEMRRKLDALDGYAMLVFSSAFDGRAATLTPGPDATLIGTFGEALPDNTPTALKAESAAPYTGQPGVPRTTPASGKGGSLMVGILVVLVLLGALWFIF